MTYPQSSPPPPSPPYPATVPGRKRIFTDGHVGIPITGIYPIDVDGLQIIDIEKFLEAFDDGFVSDESILKLVTGDSKDNITIPYEKIDGQEFPLDLIFTTEVATMVGSNLAWAELPQYSPGDGTSPESIFMNDGKRWDDNVGQYPQCTTATSNEGFLEFLADLAERQRILAKGLFLLKHTGTDFVGRAGEM